MEVSISLRTRALAFQESLMLTLPPLSGGDRTGYRRITAWLVDQVEAGRRTEEIFALVLAFAAEAAGAQGVRNRRALFVSILKKELGYEPRVHHRADA